MTTVDQALEAPLVQSGRQSEALYQAIDDLHNARSALRWSEQRYFVLVQSLEEGVVMIDAQGRFMTVNDAAHHMVGDLPELTRWFWGEDPNRRAEGLHPATETLVDGRPRTGIEMRLIGADGVSRWLRINARALLDTDSQRIAAVLCTFTDVGELKRLEEQVERLSIHDKTTGLFNRTHLEQRLQQEVDRSQRSGEPLALALLSFRALEASNVDLAQAERLVKRCAECLPLHLRSHDLVARWDKDSFGMVLPGADAQRAEAALNRCIDAIAAIRKDREGELPAVRACAAVTAWQEGMSWASLVATTVEALKRREAQVERE